MNISGDNFGTKKIKNKTQKVCPWATNSLGWKLCPRLSEAAASHLILGDACADQTLVIHGADHQYVWYVWFV